MSRIDDEVFVFIEQSNKLTEKRKNRKLKAPKRTIIYDVENKVLDDLTSKNDINEVIVQVKNDTQEKDVDDYIKNNPDEQQKIPVIYGDQDLLVLRKNTEEHLENIIQENNKKNRLETQILLSSGDKHVKDESPYSEFIVYSEAKSDSEDLEENSHFLRKATKEFLDEYSNIELDENPQRMIVRKQEHFVTYDKSMFEPFNDDEYYLHQFIDKDEINVEISPAVSDDIMCIHDKKRNEDYFDKKFYKFVLKQHPEDREAIAFFTPEKTKIFMHEQGLDHDVFATKVPGVLDWLTKDYVLQNQVHAFLGEKALAMAPSASANKLLLNVYSGKKERFFISALDQLTKKRTPPIFHYRWFRRALKSVNFELSNLPDLLKEMSTDIEELYKLSTEKISTYCCIKHEKSELRFPFKPLKLDGDGKKFNKKYLCLQICMQDRILFLHKVFRHIKESVIDDFPPLIIDIGTFRTKEFIPPKLLMEKIVNETRFFDYYVMVPWYQKMITYIQENIQNLPKRKLNRFAELVNQFIKGQILQFITTTVKDMVEKLIDPLTTPLIEMYASYTDNGILLTPTINKILKYYAALIRQVSSICKGFVHPDFYLIRGKSKRPMDIQFLDNFIPMIQKLVLNNMRDFLEPTSIFYNRLGAAVAEMTSNKFYAGLHKGMSMSDLFDMVMDCLEKRKKIRSLSDYEYIGIARVNQVYLKSAFETLVANQLNDIITELILMHIEDNFGIQKMFMDIKRRCVRTPMTTEELMALGKYLSYCRSTLMERMRLKCLLTLKHTSKLNDMIILTTNHIKHIADTVSLYRSMPEAFRKFSHLFETTRFSMEVTLRELTDDLRQSLVQFGSEYLEGLNNFDTLDKIFFYAQYLTKIIRLIEAFEERVAFINKEESLLQVNLSTYPELDELKSIVYPFAKLVLTLNKWMRTRKLWLKGPFENLKVAEIEDTIDEFFKTITLFHKQYKATCRMQALEQYPKRFTGTVDDPDFNEWPSPLKLTFLGINSIKQMKQHLPLMWILCNPYLTESHWQEMSFICGIDMLPHAGTCLQDYIDLHLDLQQYEGISVGASREAQLKEAFEKMKTEWKDVVFTVLNYKDTDIKILGSVDEIQALIDDHIIKTLSMRGSAFVKPVEEEVQAWYETLKLVNNTIDKWCKVQIQWLYLLPIFSSKYIVAQMPEEGALFHSIDRAYAMVMKEVMEEPHVLKTAGGSGNLCRVFENCLEKLEVINAGVMRYLEQKRLFFPRFFFLSNDEMLEILSETSDPKRVQPHLRKCFEGINSLEFDSNLNILKMISKENEEVPLNHMVSTVAAKGSVEIWLSQLERQMVESMRAQICRSYADYSIADRNAWLLRWPGQVVLCVSQIYWTSECHATLLRCEIRILKIYHNYLKQQLNRTIQLVRGQLNAQNRITLCALVVLDVHAKDVVHDLYEQGVKGIQDFQWLAQLRYYWYSDVIVQLTNASVRYAYEYLGNTDRLVITPLTDRCYRTLIGAYNLNLNGAPEGPAGAGKTETTKDLAKAIAVQCVVFNCSDGLDYIAMGKFFKGLASSGAWVCFDEFNRIDIEVLSVIAQQILSIVQAVRNKLEYFDFEGTKLKLNPSCYICITMNPGYAGRSELPDNLKVLFRPVAMMVPDYAMIGEISLYSYGFFNARELSVKIVTTYKLCSEQLSTQCHYDYGMRAVKTVLSAAGKLKLTYPDDNESLLVLRSIIDVNLPKFLAYDVPLFNGIISDLFPGLILPDPDYKEFHTAIDQVCLNLNLQPHPSFVTKIMQIYEMMMVRHGFMLVGEPFAGKTCSLNVLALVFGKVTETGQTEPNPAKYITLNPKAVTIGQLYGSFDPVSHEWSDGVIATAFREFANDPSPIRKWVIFDGPVDAVWIENMNTVLDDNKKLCLNSGEVIQMTNPMSMVFEVMDLTQASPATVSRCGMIYYEAKSLGWRPLALSWNKTIQEQWTKDKPDRFIQIFNWMIDPSFQFIKKMKTVIDGGEINRVWSCLKVIEMNLSEAQSGTSDFAKTYIPSMQAACILGMIWGLGGTLDQRSMEQFDKFVKDLWMGKNPEHPIPSSFDPIEITIPYEGLIMDHYYNFQGRGGWKYYPDNIKVIKLDDKSNLQSLLVPTLESTRYMDMLEKHCRHHCPVLVTGPTGTGKSWFIHNLLMTKLPLSEYSPAFMTFTMSTTANLTQDLVLGELVKKRRGVYSAPPGKLSVLFIDDVGMPVKEKFGAQPPIELIRQYFDHGYWFDLKDTTKLLIQNLLIVAAMGLPGGRQDVYKRFLRHFTLYSMCAFTDESLLKIFQTILTIGLRRNGFSTDIMSTSQMIVTATLMLFKDVCSELLPTPAKCHYVFNLRDFSRVINGHLLVRKESVHSKQTFVRLWCHEVLRVFYDRLLDRYDRAWFLDNMKKRIELDFREKMYMMLEGLNENPKDKTVTEETLRNLIFTIILDKDASVDERKYEEIPSLDAFYAVCQAALEDYNSLNKTSMNIVLFRYALEHMSRVCRILTMPGGCGLLIGVGGSGRQSLVKLAAFIIEQHVFQPEISRSYGFNEWRDDIKRLLKETGGKGKQNVFLLSEGQIKFDYFLQDVDALLNSGEVPNLFAIDEKQEILDMTRLAAQGGNRNMDISPLSVFSFFAQRSKQNLHIMLCCSPIGSTFRTRLRSYPSLVNCCTVDWYEGWPEEALEKVADKFLANVTLGETLKKAAVQVCKYFHISSRVFSEKFYAALGKTVYITSTSYLDLIKAYTTIISTKQTELRDAKTRYLMGLEKLEFAANQVTVMQKDLELLQPKLKKAVEETQEMLNGVEKERLVVDSKSAQVREDEKVANKQAESAVALKEECEHDLALAIPILDDATAALDTLKPADISLVKSMKNPPDTVKLVMAAVCVMKDIKPNMVPDPKNPTKKIMDYWGPSKRILGDMGFLQSLKDYNKDDIQPHIIQVIRKRFLPHPDFRPHIVVKASSAAEGLCKWVLAMEKYDDVVKMVAPKKIKLAQAEKEFADTKAILDAKRNELSNLEAKLADLNNKLDTALAEKTRLQNEVMQCSNKLKKARKIIGNLGGEKTRWFEEAEKLQGLYDRLPGDVLISCGVMAYLSPFTKPFRNEQIQDWKNICIESKIPTSIDYSLMKNLGNELTVHTWTMDGLPTDSFSVDNAIIMKESQKWPLFIDPQGQANQWIKCMEKKDELEVIKMSDPHYMRTLETCVIYGKPLLLENVLEDIDPPLDPILLKSTFIQGGDTYISLGENIVEYHDHFRFYMTTKLRNPHYLPEVFNKVVMINFSLTLEGLSDQLLGITVLKERPDLQEKRDLVIVQSAANRLALQNTEDEILKVLSTVKGNILEDEEAVKTLDRSKTLAVDIMQKQVAAQETQKTIEQFRQQYKSISDFCANLYYTITELPNVEPMYQFSLTWFINIYTLSIESAPKSKSIDVRIKHLKDEFMYTLYTSVSRSLFDKDKTLYSFIVCTSVMMFQNEITKNELDFLLIGGVALENELENPADWLENKSWDELCRLKDVPEMENIVNQFKDNIQVWQDFYDIPDPGFTDLPVDNYTDFQKLLIFRVFRPDRLLSLIVEFVQNKLGVRYVTPPAFDLSESYRNSHYNCALIFILSSGVDPMQSLMAFASKMDYTNKFKTVSLGQGQGPRAEELIKKAQAQGEWICLQNCHLCLSWLPTLEKICEDFDPTNTSIYFRLWLTSYPTPKFPEAILQNGVKITNEPPTGLQQILLRLYNSEPVNTPDFYDSCDKKEAIFAKMLFGLSFFHAVVLERKKFGSIGWNNPYGFNESDYLISIQQLQMYLLQYLEIPYDAVLYLTGECNYGGRVTDNWDRRTLNTLLSKYINRSIVNQPNFNLAPPNETYSIPAQHTYSDFLGYIRNLPRMQSPEIYGLHSNAGIKRSLNEFKLLMESMVLVSERGVLDNKGESELLKKIIDDIVVKLPPQFDVESAEEKYPVDYSESMNTVLVQEMNKFNILLKYMKKSLEELKMGILGKIIMTPEMEAISNSLLKSKVPHEWGRYSYPSLLPLGPYIQDLLKRLEFLKNWFLNGQPKEFWISGFYFTHSFLTGTMQNYARLTKISIDQLTYDFEILKDETPIVDNGVIVYGLFIEGSRWDRERHHLVEQYPKMLYDSLPRLWVKPIEKKYLLSKGRYPSPLYRTSERRGVLSTTGHSTNYIFPVLLEISATDTISHWILRGVALLCEIYD